MAAAIDDAAFLTLMAKLIVIPGFQFTRAQVLRICLLAGETGIPLAVEYGPVAVDHMAKLIIAAKEYVKTRMEEESDRKRERELKRRDKSNDGKGTA